METNMNTRQAMILMALVAAMLSACSPQPSAEEKMAAVNDENCEPESIAKIADKATRNQLADMCVHRNRFKPSPKRAW
jgi:entry exclusion lipoprotein TrbK